MMASQTLSGAGSLHSLTLKRPLPTFPVPASQLPPSSPAKEERSTAKPEDICVTSDDADLGRLSVGDTDLRGSTTLTPEPGSSFATPITPTDVAQYVQNRRASGTAFARVTSAHTISPSDSQESPGRAWAVLPLSLGTFTPAHANSSSSSTCSASESREPAACSVGAPPLRAERLLMAPAAEAAAAPRRAGSATATGRSGLVAALIRIKCSPHTAGFGSRQAPCFGHAEGSSSGGGGGLLYMPAGDRVFVHNPGSDSPATHLETAPLGLSAVVQASAYDPAIRLLLLGDQNGLASHLVALDPATAALRWATPEGALNSCCGIAVLPAQSVVVSSSLRDLQVRRVGTGEHLATLGNLDEPTFLAADAASGTVFASLRRVVQRSGTATGAVSAFRWDGVHSRLERLGEVLAAGDTGGAHRPIAVIPASLASRHGGRGAYLVVGTLGSPTLRILALPACRLVHEHVLPGHAAVAGLAADAEGTQLAVVDAASGGTLVLDWPLSSMPRDHAPHALERQPGGRAASLEAGAGGGEALRFLCLACKEPAPGVPQAECSRCADAAAPDASPGASLLFRGWLCEPCRLAHGGSGARLCRHADATTHASTGLDAPFSIASEHAPLTRRLQRQARAGLGEPDDAARGGAAAAEEEADSAPSPQQACVSSGGWAGAAAPILYIPGPAAAGPALHLFGQAGDKMPGLGAAALALHPGGAVLCCASDSCSGTLLVSDGVLLVAVDADRRAVRWAVPLPGCASLCIVPLAVAAGVAGAHGSIIVAAVRHPGRLCLLHVEDGSSATAALPLRLATALLLPDGGVPWAVAADARSGTVFVSVQAQRHGPPAEAAAGRRPASVHTVVACQWTGNRVRGGGGGPAPRRLAITGVVDVPTDTGAEGRPRPLAVVPPAAGHHTPFLVVAGCVGGACVLHVLVLPTGRLALTHHLDATAVAQVRSLAADPSGRAIVVLCDAPPALAAIVGGDGGLADVGSRLPPAPLRISSSSHTLVLPWPLPGLRLAPAPATLSCVLELRDGSGPLGGARPLPAGPRQARACCTLMM